MIRVYVVDDEELARKRLITLLENTGMDVQIAGQSGDPSEAVSEIRELKPDAVFLDIQMPVLDGFDVVDLLGDDRPAIIFVTAFDEFAIRAFEVYAVDYLTKPVRIERLRKSLERIAGGSRDEANFAVDNLMKNREPKELKRISAHSAHGIQVIELNEIHYFEADDKLLYVHFGDKKMRVDFTLDELEKRLSPGHFIRIHRSYIVHAAKIRSVEPWFNGGWRVMLSNGSDLPVARRRVTDVKKSIGYK